MSLIPSLPFVYPEEKTFLDNLEMLGGMITSDYPDWGKHLWQLFGEALPLYQDKNTPIERKYQFALKVKSLWGGMGSLNDGPFSEANEKKILELYESIGDVLRVYWKVLGYEHHEEPFEIIPIGSVVRIVPGKIGHYQNDGKPHFIDEKENSNLDWIIIGHLGRDITNMPLYSLKSGNFLMYTRQEGLKILRLPAPGLNPPTPVSAANPPLPWKKFLLLLAALTLVILAKIWLDRLEVQNAVPVQKYLQKVTPDPTKT
jgi:hypothetical protein